MEKEKGTVFITCVTTSNERKLESPHETTAAPTSHSDAMLREVITGIARGNTEVHPSPCSVEVEQTSSRHTPLESTCSIISRL